MRSKVISMTASELRLSYPLFDESLSAKLLAIGQEVNYESGHFLMRPGQYFRSAILILDGKVKVYREGAEGEEFFLYYLEPGSACALSMICAARNEASALKAMAITPVRALSIPIHHMDELMREHRQWYYFVLETYRHRFEELLQVIDQVVFHSMDEKLEFYLKRQFGIFGDQFPVTHQQIADDLNSSREVISRLLKKLESSGLIKISRNEIQRTGLR